MPHLESSDGDAEQLELLREVEDGEEDGAEEGDLQEAEHDQPREQEVAHSPVASKRGRERERELPMRQVPLERDINIAVN